MLLDAAAGPAPSPAAFGESRYLSKLSRSYLDYDRALFVATLNDWGWFGQGRPPSWYRCADIGGLTRLRIMPLLERRPYLVEFDEECVKGYMEASGVAPVVVFETDEGLMLADGYHRVEAAMRRGQTTIEAEIRPGG